MFCFLLSRKLNTISNKISGEYLNMFIDLSSCASFFEKEKYIDRAQIML